MLRQLLPLLVAVVTAAPPSGAEAAGSVADGGPAGRVALSGPWTLRLDPSATGTAKGYAAGRFGGRRVRVPYVPNARHIRGRAGKRAFNGTVGWYRTSFTVPHDGDYALRFESINHRATIWLDGVEMGTHIGEYLPFDIHTALRTGRRHVLVVRADWRDPEHMKHTGWHRSWFNFGGINREVTIRPVGRSELDAPTIRTTLGGDGVATVDVSVRVTNRDAARPVQVMGALVRDGARIPLAFPSRDVPAGAQRVVRAQAVVPKPALWAPGHPDLYELQLYVPDESAWHSKVGLREIRRDGPDLFLNGQRLVLHGASLQEDAKGHGDALTSPDMDRIVAALQRIHANATRVQHPLSPALLERLDAAGILVWQGVGPVDSPGNWMEVTPYMRKVSRHRVRTSVEQLQTHPSILTWNLANEVANQGHSGGQAGYIDREARWLHRHDPSRPVALDVWGTHPPSYAGPMYRHIDVIGTTNYIGWYEATFASQAQVARVIRRKVGALRAIFSDRALVVTEFGAEANDRNPSLRPGGFGFQARLLGTHIRTYASMPELSGMLMWNLRDFAVSPSFLGGSISGLVPNIKLVRGLNQKGLFDYRGRPKPAAAVVSDLYAGLGS